MKRSCKETAGELDGTEGGSGNMSMDDSSRCFWTEKERLGLDVIAWNRRRSVYSQLEGACLRGVQAP